MDIFKAYAEIESIDKELYRLLFLNEKCLKYIPEPDNTIYSSDELGRISKTAREHDLSSQSYKELSVFEQFEYLANQAGFFYLRTKNKEFKIKDKGLYEQQKCII
ncbi:MAG: hypothetical protein KAJ20_03295 [Candidatus Aenigmarchaeota archaeon]|nr:hypothetical protein [Candidatus Aenigmarchaeota archaeon]MCK5063332.1 hypothetical protein [Candidatus Aenigmarchaeota archaeon]MCK5290017.1 hypothetical protein [Candidatus Aenigmarchaeota archaeon]MCK5373337.1 hypothetical protein [Candidatus Aenigmarchaeota archaeon]MCK5452412.1 hypothetical protein [Candidatus Aenigmarchaeota archaeon]